MNNNVGIGLGSFFQGFSNGIGIRRDLDEAKLRREELDTFKKNREETDAFNTQAKTEFDNNVAAGKAKPGDAADFMIRVKGPERAAMYVRQGKYSEAKSWTDWYKSEGAAKGTSLFGKALFKAQAGDVSGAIDTAVEAAQVKGYLDHSFELAGKDEVKDADGNVSGYRVRLKNGDGEEAIWDVDANNVVAGISSIFNPEAAYQSKLAAKEKRDAAALEVETFGAKAAITDQFDSRKEDRKFGHEVALVKTKKKLGGDGAPPADVASAEWLAKQLAASEGREVSPKDLLKSYEQVRQAKDNPNSRAALVVRVVESFNKDPRDRRSGDEKQAAARKFVDDIQSESKTPDKPKAAPLPLPPELKGAKDGTVVQDDESGQKFEIRAGQLVPVE